MEPPNARHHPPAAACDDESRAGAGRVRAVVRRMPPAELFTPARFRQLRPAPRTISDDDVRSPAVMHDQAILTKAGGVIDNRIRALKHVFMI